MFQKKNLNPFDFEFIESKKHFYKLDPFWIGPLDESQKASRIKDFTSQIYTTWASIFKIDNEQDADRNKAGVTERETIHKCDLAIHASGIKVNRFAPEGERKKATGHALDQVKSRVPWGVR